MDTTGMAMAMEETTRLDDLPESCVAHVLALTSPRDVCRCAAVSPSFRDAAESDTVWERFLPADYRALLLRSSSGSGSGSPQPPPSSKKEAYLRLSDSAVLVGDTAVWLARGSGAKCVALSARKLSLPWDDGEFSWRWTPHALSRYMINLRSSHSCSSLRVNFLSTQIMHHIHLPLVHPCMCLKSIECSIILER
jgi:hypothetical protein